MKNKKTPEMLSNLNAYWRAYNYLAAGMICLKVMAGNLILSKALIR